MNGKGDPAQASGRFGQKEKKRVLSKRLRIDDAEKLDNRICEKTISIMKKGPEFPIEKGRNNAADTGRRWRRGGPRREVQVCRKPAWKGEGVTVASTNID